ncbi:MAG: hypothetical protein J6S85_07435 [Methanobrevibacter sp.]|nr:hypothetical protein [Methanobrevibacter sp.]
MANEPFVNFSLKTQDKIATTRIVKQLKDLFGEENVEIDNFETWVTITISNTKGWIGVNDIGYYGQSRLHVYRDMGERPNVSLDIPLDLCDTIYKI